MVYEGPKPRPQSQPEPEWDRRSERTPNYGWDNPEPTWGHGAMLPDKPLPPPKFKQLNLFEYHGIDPSKFETPLLDRIMSRPLWGMPQGPQQGLEPEGEYPWRHHYAPDKKPERPRRWQRSNTPEPQPERSGVKQPDPSQFILPDLSGLKAIRDYMTVHPEDPLPRGANLDEWLAKAEAFKAKQDGVTVASGRAPGRGATPDTPVEQFQHRLKEGAIHRLEQNKARLNQVQGSYKDTQPSNEQWQTLRTLAKRDHQLKQLQDQTNQELMTLLAKKEFSNTPLGRLANQTPLGKILGLPKSDPIHNELLLNVLGTSPQDIDPKYRDQFEGLRGRLELLHTVRQEMRAVHPALAVLDTDVVSKMVNNEWNNSVIYREMGKGFDGMRSDMTKLSGTIEDDPSKALLFEALKPEILKTFKTPHSENRRANGQSSRRIRMDCSKRCWVGVQLG